MNVCHGCATYFEHIQIGQPKCGMPENWKADCPCSICLVKGMCHKLCNPLETYYNNATEYDYS